jgi:photosystem II stability/assembly factor-like uncharacterized protein
MTRLLFLLLLCACAQANTMGGTAPCPIQRGAAAGRYVWLLCDRRDLFVSADQGLTWQTRHVPFDVKFRAITFLDSRRGFIAGHAGTLLATEDGAETWRQVPLPTQENLTAIHFVGDSGWLAGWSGVILHSADAGKTWEQQQSGTRQGLEGIFFVDADHGWAVGWNAALLRTSDGGRTWEKVSVPKGVYSLDSVYFRDVKSGWAVGFGGHILRSRDGGVTWQEQASTLRDWLKSVVFDNSGRGWIASDNSLLLSEDGGDTWTSIPIAGTVFVGQVLPVNDSVWAVGMFGVLRQNGREQGFTAIATLPVADRAEGTS